MNTAAHDDPLIQPRQHQEGVPDRRGRNARARRRALSTSAAANTCRFPGRRAAASRRCSRSSACSTRRATAPTSSTAATSPTSAPSERAQIRNKEIGFVFQAFNLIGDLTVFENVELPLTYREGVSKQRTPRAHDRRARARRHGASREAFPGAAFRRPAAARRRRARAGRTAVDPARRRADRQPRFEERRSGDARCSTSCTSRARRSAWSRTIRATPISRSARSSCSTAASSTRRRCIACVTKKTSA